MLSYPAITASSGVCDYVKDIGDLAREEFARISRESTQPRDLLIEKAITTVFYYGRLSNPSSEIAIQEYIEYSKTLKKHAFLDLINFGLTVGAGIALAPLTEKSGFTATHLLSSALFCGITAYFVTSYERNRYYSLVSSTLSYLLYAEQNNC